MLGWLAPDLSRLITCGSGRSEKSSRYQVTYGKSSDSTASTPKLLPEYVAPTDPSPLRASETEVTPDMVRYLRLISSVPSAKWVGMPVTRRSDATSYRIRSS